MILCVPISEMNFEVHNKIYDVDLPKKFNMSLI